MTTQQTRDSETVIEVRGAWQGQPGDPDRRFMGIITTSELPQLTPGEAVQVTYQVARNRTTGAEEHGTYTLSGGGRTLPLMRFTCPNAGLTGQEGNNDRQQALWQAAVLPDTRRS